MLAHLPLCSHIPAGRRGRRRRPFLQGRDPDCDPSTSGHTPLAGLGDMATLKAKTGWKNVDSTRVAIYQLNIIFFCEGKRMGLTNIKQSVASVLLGLGFCEVRHLSLCPRFVCLFIYLLFYFIFHLREREDGEVAQRERES